MDYRRGMAFAISFLIIGIIGQLVFPQIVESAQTASIIAIVLASLIAYCTILILRIRGIVPA